jgi:hypothetical protein
MPGTMTHRQQLTRTTRTTRLKRRSWTGMDLKEAKTTMERQV